VHIFAVCRGPHSLRSNSNIRTPKANTQYRPEIVVREPYATRTTRLPHVPDFLSSAFTSCVSLRRPTRNRLTIACLYVYCRPTTFPESATTEAQVKYTSDQIVCSTPEPSTTSTPTIDMCVASLNVSTQPCAHRWYDLRRACTSSNNLANCPERLQLEGWEIRNPTCPWCGDESEISIHESTHRLFGSTSPMASSPTLSEMGNTRSRRSGSNATMESLSRVSSIASVEGDSTQRGRDMNERLDIYLRSLPHEVLPSAAKNYPTYSQSSSASTSADETTLAEFQMIRRTSSGLSRGWKKSLRFSIGMLRT